MHLFDSFYRGRGQGLADGIEYRTVGLNRIPDAENLTRIQGEAAVGNITSRVSVE